MLANVDKSHEPNARRLCQALADSFNRHLDRVHGDHRQNNGLRPSNA